jgi:hypothetical protein
MPLTDRQQGDDGPAERGPPRLGQSDHHCASRRSIIHTKFFAKGLKKRSTGKE